VTANSSQHCWCSSSSQQSFCNSSASRIILRVIPGFMARAGGKEPVNQRKHKQPGQNP
jgi:hypothetical protein